MRGKYYVLMILFLISSQSYAGGKSDVSNSGKTKVGAAKPVKVIRTMEQHKVHVENSKKPTIIKFFATWCGPCQYMAPLFEQLAEELNDTYNFIEVNINNVEDELIKKYNVRSLPTIIFVKDNNIKHKAIGAKDKKTLRDLAKKHLT